MKQNRNYPAAELEDSVKSKIARLYLLQKDKGTSRKAFTAEMGEAGFHFSERQLNRWVSLTNSGMEAVSPDKLAGRPCSLTRPQRDILSGMVLDQIDHGVPVHLDTVCDFSLAHFSIIISQKSASNYLKEDGFTYRVIQKKASSFVIDGERLKFDLWNWVSSHQIYLNNILRSKLCSIDFTFTGHRTERRSGFGVKGGAQPMESLQISKYTNCIVTVVWADGKNRTPPVCFTYNQNFRIDRKSTARRDEQVEYLRERLAHHGIDKSRVIYIGKEKGEK
jgi:transposase